MEKITKELIQSACDTHDFEGLMDNFFRITTGFGGGMELETWTTGGVNMIFCLQEPNKVDEFLDLVSDFDIDEEISVHRQDQRYCDAFTTAESVADFTEFKEWLENVAAIVRHIYFGNTLPDIDGISLKFSATVIFGTEAVDYYVKNGDSGLKKFIEHNGGIIKTVEFDTEAELKAYKQAILDYDGWYKAFYFPD